MNMNDFMKISTDLLQFIKESDTINPNNEKGVADWLEQMNKASVIAKHPYKISEMVKHNEIYFITYLYDETKKNNRRQITAKSKTDLENKIYKNYLDKQARTFENIYHEWYNTAYKTKVKATAYARMGTDFTRFVESTDFAKKPLSHIDSFDVEDFLHNAIIQHKLKLQGYKNLKSLLNGVFKYARKKKYITENPVDLAEISMAHIVPPKKKYKEEVVFTTKEAELIKEVIAKDRNNYDISIPFALLFSFQLGLRVSELIALKWSDIKHNTIYVQRQEICYTTHENGKKRTVHEIVEYTKTKAGDRILPLSHEAVSILDDVKKWNKEHNISSEFIFADKKGNNFKRQRVNDRLYKYCQMADIIKKSTHKIRRCVVSTLLDNVKNKDSVRVFAGHENIQTTFNAYYKDISSDEDFFKEMCACL